MSARDEAVRALSHLIARLGGDQPLDTLERRQLTATAAYAREQVDMIQELKRPRRRRALITGDDLESAAVRRGEL